MLDQKVRKSSKSNVEMSNAHKNQLEWIPTDEMGKILIAVTKFRQESSTDAKGRG